MEEGGEPDQEVEAEIHVGLIDLDALSSGTSDELSSADEAEPWTDWMQDAHLDPWIEIWDRNRSEADIDSRGDRAIAAAKVRNGIIEKVITTAKTVDLGS